MRRKEWDHALSLLRKAINLEPKCPVSVEYWTGAISPRRLRRSHRPSLTVLRDQPDSAQARYLFGLCQFLPSNIADAVATLEPLWAQQSNDVMYLYTLDIAAQNAGKHELDEKALAQMIEIGSNTAEYHLILAKAYLNREETEKAIAELRLASAANPRVPFLHFNLGLAYVRAGDNDRAESEFLQDIAIEPDLPDNYEQLGLIYSRLQRDADAEKSFREALRFDQKEVPPFSASPGFICSSKNTSRLLTAVDAALKLVPGNQSGHFMRGQALMREGRQRRRSGRISRCPENSRLPPEQRSRRPRRRPHPQPGANR